MIIDNLDMLCASLNPLEAYAIPFVDADAELPSAVALQRLQPVSRWNSQILNGVRVVQHPELAQRDTLECCKKAAALAGMPNFLRLAISEAFNQYAPSIMTPIINVKR